MATAATDQNLIEAIATELASSVEAAVDQWMAEFESVLQNPRLTMLARLQAIQDVVTRYKYATGKSELPGSRSGAIN